MSGEVQALNPMSPVYQSRWLSWLVPADVGASNSHSHNRSVAMILSLFSVAPFHIHEYRVSDETFSTRLRFADVIVYEIRKYPADICMHLMLAYCYG